MLSVVAALYLLLRKSNAIVPGVTPPLRLRRRAAAFMLFAAVSHVTWIFYIYHPSTPGYILAYTLDVRKLTTKNWAKHSKVSPDTALRDIKDLEEQGILEPQSGRVRDVSYGIRCNPDILLVPGPNDEEHGTGFLPGSN